MCLILDNDISHEFTKESKDAEPIMDWLESRNGVVATGGKNLEELLGTGIRRLLLEYLRSGRARNFSGTELDARQTLLERDGGVRSNDHHVLALASVSRWRVLYTRDRKLMDDFRDKRFVDDPRGAIYSSRLNADLLERCANC